MSLIIERMQDGGYKVNSPVVFSCGCGGNGALISSLLSAAGVPNVPTVNTPNNLNARNFIKSSGLLAAEPSLGRGKHAVLFNPSNGLFINLLGGKKTDRNILKKIYTVVNSK